MSKIKGIRIGSGFVLSEESGHYRIKSVSGNFSLMVDASLPLYAACREAVANLSFRPVLHDLVVFCAYPAGVKFTQKRFDEYVRFLDGFSARMQEDSVPATDAEHDGALRQVREDYGMRGHSDEGLVADPEPGDEPV